MFFLSVPVLIGRAIGLLLGFTIHEWAHAWSAFRLGDKTAFYQGRLTLDPRAHIDPMGIFMALLAGFGWAKPVPVNPRAFYPNEQRGLLLVSLAGPVTNLIIAFVFAVAFRLMVVAGLFVDSGRVLVSSNATVIQGDGSLLQLIYVVMSTIIFFNLVLFLFNLIPLAPLDGWKIMLGLVPPRDAYQLSQHEQEAMFILMMLIMVSFISDINILGTVLGPPLNFLFQLFTGAGFYPQAV